jgi:ppGpp synthetase/RelA/SpoT-type nucleotidyltranferase
MTFSKDIVYFATFIASLGGAWVLIRYQVGELIKSQKAMFDKLDGIGEKVVLTEQDMHTLKREVQELNTYKQKITVLEQTTAHHIDLLSVEEKFVTRKEFEITIKNFDKDIQDIKGGQYEILKFLKRQFKENND